MDSHFIPLEGQTSKGPLVGAVIEGHAGGTALIFDYAEGRVVPYDKAHHGGIGISMTGVEPLAPEPPTEYCIANAAGSPGRAVYGTAVEAAIALSARPDQYRFNVVVCKGSEVRPLDQRERELVRGFLTTHGLADRIPTYLQEKPVAATP